MLKAVLDANVIASALIHPQGPPGTILKRLFQDKAFELIMSPAIISEIRGCLNYPRLRRYIQASDKDLNLWISSLEFIADVVTGSMIPTVAIDDPADIIYLAAAAEGRADYLVSGDHHLLRLHHFETIRIVTPRAFLGML